MSIDNATPDEWDRTAYLGRLAAESAVADLTPRDIEALNRVLDKPFGEVPLAARAYVFLLHQMGKIAIENGGTIYPDWPAYHSTARYQVRAIEKPKTKPSIDWSQIKPEYKWLARDDGGEAYVFTSKPGRNPGVWFGDGTARVDNLTSYTPGTCNWQDSLVERPA